MSDEVLVSVDGPVRTVVLNRPAKRNALNSAMLELLAAAFPPDPPADERVAVVRAEGPVFCAGIDLSERSAGGAVGIEEALHAIEAYPLPVIAVVAGDAIAGGAELAIHCDIVVAAASARIGMSLAQIGLAPPWPLAVKLLDVAGPTLARQLLFLGDPVPAGRLADLGVIATAVADNELAETVAAAVERLAANAPLSLRAIKAALVRAQQVRDGVDHADIDALVAAARRSEDAREGMRARLEKRTPVFKGR